MCVFHAMEPTERPGLAAVMLMGDMRETQLVFSSLFCQEGTLSEELNAHCQEAPRRRYGAEGPPLFQVEGKCFTPDHLHSRS